MSETSRDPSRPAGPHDRRAEIQRLQRALAMQQAAMRSMAMQMTMAEERERRRIATDLHDRVGQLLALSRIAVDQVVSTTDPEARTAALEVLGERLKGAIDETRTLEFDLSPPVLRQFGLSAALESLAEDHDGVAGASCSFTDDGDERPLPEDVRATLYRTGRELFLNAIKHSGARVIGISLRTEEGMAVVEVTDDGRGMPADAATHGFGLRSLEERLVALGGRLGFAEREGGGTVASVALPLAGKDLPGETLTLEDASGGAPQRLGDARQFDARLEEAVAAAAASGDPLAVCVLETVGLDAFSRRRGYEAGDSVLRDLGSTVAAAVAGSGEAFRLGGEEFAVVLPRVDDVAAYQLALRIEMAFSERVGMSDLRIAGGIAVLPDHGLEAGVLLGAARNALEWSEALGRGGITLYEPDLADALDARSYVGRLSYTAITGMARALLTALSARDQYTEDHCRRVGLLAADLARTTRLPEESIRMLRSAALLHDVGNIAVPQAILTKPGPLDADERRTVERHAPVGEWILQPAAPAEILPWIRSHHERWDGTGYPDGLRQTEIPVEARILAVCDAWDAMSQDRPYRARLDREDRVEELRRGAGGQFDPDLVDAFAGLLATGSPALSSD